MIILLKTQTYRFDVESVWKKKYLIWIKWPAQEQWVNSIHLNKWRMTFKKMFKKNRLSGAYVENDTVSTVAIIIINAPFQNYMF